MQKSVKILFYQNGDPLEARCIQRFVKAFSKGYGKVVGRIIRNSVRLSERSFKENVATLMPPFKMTRAGAFHKVRIDKKGVLHDRHHTVALCWQQVKDDLKELKRYMRNNVSGKRSRLVANLSSAARNEVIGRTSRIYEKLLQTNLKVSNVTPVAASKVLFATLPEIALPVDNLEWSRVFEIEKKLQKRAEGYERILSTMISEINQWENKSKRHLDELDPQPATTLPSIYNILAMSVRPLASAKW